MGVICSPVYVQLWKVLVIPVMPRNPSFHVMKHVPIVQTSLLLGKATTIWCLIFFIFQCPKPGIYLFPALKGETIHTINKQKIYLQITQEYITIYYHLMPHAILLMMSTYWASFVYFFLKKDATSDNNSNSASTTDCFLFPSSAVGVSVVSSESTASQNLCILMSTGPPSLVCLAMHFRMWFWSSQCCRILPVTLSTSGMYTCLIKSTWCCSFSWSTTCRNLYYYM